ncbi:MAG: N-acetyltransferase DgcN [Kiloniellales bacterium]
MAIEQPYLLFLGDAPDQLAAKTARGIADWRPENCVGQLRFTDCRADVGLSDMSLDDAVAAGAKTLVVGVANRGGVFSDAWMEVLEQALDQGLDLAAGLHGKLADVPQLTEAAARNGRRLFDVRHPSQTFAVGDGEKRPGKRLLTVGTDCSCGKMYTSLALDREMRARGMNADFRATGQSGILIVGDGVSVDAVVADFISGATEWLSPANDPDHWDVIEGQGSLFHASFAGVSMGLLHGAQPDALVMCHEPTRSHMRGLPDYGLPDLQLCIDTNLTAARLTNPDVRCIGVAVNTSLMDADAARRYVGETEKELGLPVVDPVRHGVAPLVDQLI